jgi:hypothetical protein
MKAGQIIKLAILLFYAASCTGGNHEEPANENDDIDTTIVAHSNVSNTFQRGKVIPNVVCEADPAQSYALYIPSKSQQESLPIIYFFDPHGDGSLPLDKYKSLADEYNFIFIGSNNSKNGNDWSTAEDIWNALSGDIQKRLKINSSRIYLCGFSGGAKVATYLALHHTEVKGVIANGAGLPDIVHSGNFNFSFTAIAGEGDLNMTDLVAITNGLDQTKTNHRIIFFDGIHEWAPLNTMKTALEGLQLDAMNAKLIPLNQDFINNYVNESQQKIAADIKSGRYLDAENECKFSLTVLGGITNDVKWFEDKDAAIQANAAYKRELKMKDSLLTKEQNIKSGYEQQFQKGDIKYWTNTIYDVQTKAKAHNAEAAMYQRLKAYLSLAFYSISNQLINSNQNSDAEAFVNLYKLVDPSNSEAWYLSAILDARNNNAKATQDDLLKAIANGFSDKIRLEKQSEFQTIASQINLGALESKMK